MKNSLDGLTSIKKISELENRAIETIQLFLKKVTIVICGIISRNVIYRYWNSRKSIKKLRQKICKEIMIKCI